MTDMIDRACMACWPPGGMGWPELVLVAIGCLAMFLICYG